MSKFAIYFEGSLPRTKHLVSNTNTVIRFCFGVVLGGPMLNFGHFGCVLDRHWFFLGVQVRTCSLRQ